MPAAHAARQQRSRKDWGLVFNLDSEILNWHDHMNRHPNLPASRVLRTKDADWLRDRRAQFAVSCQSIRARAWSVLAGRTDTRIEPGHIATRWEEGVRYARNVLPQTM